MRESQKMAVWGRRDVAWTWGCLRGRRGGRCGRAVLIGSPGEHLASDEELSCRSYPLLRPQKVRNSQLGETE